MAGVAVLVACAGHAHQLYPGASSSAAVGQPKTAATRSPRPPEAGAILGTLPFPPQETELFAARARSLFVLVVPAGRAALIRVERLDPDGVVTRSRVRFDLPTYLMDVSAGRDGIYAGTAVIKRFSNVPDELVRIDSRRLTILARASFPASVAAVEQGRDVWASLGDGRVVRLDPRTLATEASRQVLATGARATGSATLSKPVLGLGSLWVLAGDESDLELVRMNPTTLAISSKTRVPTRGDLYQALNRVVADSRHVYLVGSAIVAVDATGKLIGRPVLVPGLVTAELHGTGLVGLTTGDRPSLVLLDAHGRILARTGLLDAGARLAVSGGDAWFLGDAGRGNGIIHVHLPAR